MTNEQAAGFARAIEVAVRRLDTRNAAAIRDHIVKLLYPRTMKEAEDEGALQHFLAGVTVAVRRVLRQMESDGLQHDLGEVHPKLFPYVQILKHPSYFVPSLGEYLTIVELIETPTLLDEARVFLRRKGEEVIAEAERLDDLFKAVTAMPVRMRMPNVHAAHEARPHA